MDNWNIVVKIDGNRRMLTVPKDCLVSQLIQATSDASGIEPERIALIHANLNEMLTMEKPEIYDQRLSKFELKNRSLLILVLRSVGGKPIAKLLKAICDRKKTLQDLPGFITVTMDPKDIDMISLVSCSADYRAAKMPCGHVIGPESMTSYCQSLVSAKKFIFICPYSNNGVHCNQEWSFALVRHVACLTDDGLEELEEAVAETVLMKSRGTQQCPGCENWCYRNNPNNDCVVCSVCTKKNKGKAYQFCWQCLTEWKGSRSRCQNLECSNTITSLEILANCKEKMIQGTNMCPSTRGCPKCGQLIEHAGECKHMTCSVCKCDFCFFCLTEKKGPKWACMAFRGDCKVAPRQTKLPEPKKLQSGFLYDASDYQRSSS